MDNLSGRDFLKTLKSLEIETGSITGESLDWLFDKRNTSDILTWMCLYLNENNIQKCNEIQEYSTLLNEEKNVSQEYIDDAFKSKPILEDIYNVSISEIKSIKRDIENATRRSNHLTKLTNKYLSVEGKLNRSIEDDDLNLRIKRKTYLSNCIEAGKQVDKLHTNMYEKEEQFSHILSNFNTMQDKYFISQMPLHTYEQQCEIFQTNLHLWIRKKFEISKFNYSEEDINSIDQELNRLYFMIKECITKHIQSECNREELTTKLNCFRNSTYSEIPDEHRTVQEIQYTSRINILYEELRTLYTHDLQQAVEKLSENLINTVLIKNAENKLNNCIDMLTTLKNLNNEIVQALAQYQLLILLLKTDKMKLRDIDKFLDDLYFYSSNYLTNYSLRSQLINEIENNVVKEEFVFREIISILTETYDDSLNIREAISEVEKQKIAIENLENDLFIIRNQKFVQEVKQIEQNMIAVRKIIWCGPTLQPVIIPFQYLDNLNISNCQIEKVDKMIKNIMDDFNNTRVLIKKNTWLTHRRLLWVWFLMKPEKISLIIQQLKNYVTERAKTNT